MLIFRDVEARSPLLPFIREAGYAVREPWYLPERRLLDYLLIFVQEGSMRVTREEEALLFEEGSFCLLQPGDLHTLGSATRTITPFLHLDLFYNPLREQSFPTRPGQVDLTAFAELMQPRLNDMQGVQLGMAFLPDDAASFRETMLQAIGCWLEGGMLGRLEANQLAHRLAIAILKSIPAFEHPQYQKPQSLNWITSYFSFHLAEPLSLADMARRAQLSPSRFSAVFKEKFGVAPHRYLLRMRVRHAQELLRTTAHTLETIAEYCGFADVHHFAKAFKKMTGETPGAYRKRM